MIRRILITTLMTLGLVLAVAPVASAVFPFDDVCDSNTTDAAACQASTDDPISGTNGVILKVVDILSFVIGVASVILIIIGGLKYVASAGDSNSINSAKNTILYAIVGLALAAFAQLIVRFVIGRI